MKKQTKEDNNLDDCTCVAEKEFNLGEKIFESYTGDKIEGFAEWYYAIYLEDVKEFIRLLKQDLLLSVNHHGLDWCPNLFIKHIDALAGDKLK